MKFLINCIVLMVLGFVGCINASHEASTTNPNGAAAPLPVQVVPYPRRHTLKHYRSIQANMLPHIESALCVRQPPENEQKKPKADYGVRETESPALPERYELVDAYAQFQDEAKAQVVDPALTVMNKQLQHVHDYCHQDPIASRAIITALWEMSKVKEVPRQNQSDILKIFHDERAALEKEQRETGSRDQEAYNRLFQRYETYVRQCEIFRFHQYVDEQREEREEQTLWQDAQQDLLEWYNIIQACGGMKEYWKKLRLTQKVDQALRDVLPDPIIAIIIHYADSTSSSS